jgi:uncharacterized membrane protein YcjF (UPF0283 family)
VNDGDWAALGIGLACATPFLWALIKFSFKNLPKVVRAMTRSSYDFGYEFDEYQKSEKRKATPPVTTKTKREHTTFGHAARGLGYILATFAVIGGAVGAVVGDIKAWQSLPWLYALYITIALASIVIGIFLYNTE